MFAINGNLPCCFIRYNGIIHLKVTKQVSFLNIGRLAQNLLGCWTVRGLYPVGAVLACVPWTDKTVYTTGPNFISLILYIFIFISLSTLFDCNVKKSKSEVVDSLVASPYYISLCLMAMTMCFPLEKLTALKILICREGGGNRLLVYWDTLRFSQGLISLTKGQVPFLLKEILYIFQHECWNQNSVNIEICALLGYYAASCGNCLPTFRYNVSVPSLRVKSPRRKERRHRDVDSTCEGASGVVISKRGDSQ
jgi:hypothetical protein